MFWVKALQLANKDEMNKFAMAIENMVATTDNNYIDAIVQYCKDSGLEIEIAATLVNSNLKSKIDSDAIDANMFKEKVARLPI